MIEAIAIFLLILKFWRASKEQKKHCSEVKRDFSAHRQKPIVEILKEVYRRNKDDGKEGKWR